MNNENSQTIKPDPNCSACKGTGHMMDIVYDEFDVHKEIVDCFCVSPTFKKVMKELATRSDK